MTILKIFDMLIAKEMIVVAESIMLKKGKHVIACFPFVFPYAFTVLINCSTQLA